MKVIELDKLLSQIDWSSVSPKFLEKAVEEYRIRSQEAEDIKAQNFTLEELEVHYYGMPVVFQRKKHAYKIALDSRLEEMNNDSYASQN